MTSVKDACHKCHEWINRCTCPPDPLKAKLGFEREAEEIYIPWNTDDDQYRWVCRKAIAAALEAAFSKGTEEGYRKATKEADERWDKLTDQMIDGTADASFNKGFSDGWNACQIEAAKLAEHYSDCSCHCGEWLSDEIRALKPAEGESR